MKILDKIQAAISEKKPFYSFEYFPPKTEHGVYNLYERFERMLALEPCFIDITWGAGGSTADSSFEIAKNAQQFFGVDVMMHLTCTNSDKEKIRDVLRRVKEAGIDNIMALRGDPPEGESTWKHTDHNLKYGSDLVKLINEEYPGDFCIGVGGYPEGHLESESLDSCIDKLKIKVDSGADFIVTQLFYDMEKFKRFVDKCRSAGIEIPIVPGVLPIHNYERFTKFTKFLKIKVPDEISRKLEELKHDDSDIIDYGIELGMNMSEELVKFGSPGIHFYTLNLETSVTKIIDGLGWANECRERRHLPWRKPTTSEREQESVRPIYWSNRPKSYLTRTREWDDFPNGRWGDSRSPSFGALDNYYLIGKAQKNDKIKEQCLAQWGVPKTLEDIQKVFSNFCEGKINRLPWCEMPVQAETSFISKELMNVNKQGFFTINSQPQINGAPSSDPVVGWGGAGGYIYQKAYLEFFTSEENLRSLLNKVEAQSTVTLQAVNRKGETIGNVDENVTAVTWGVFPGKEIVQPTVVDYESFMIWKDEAFSLWKSSWMSLYPEGSESYELIKEIMENYYLVNLVENDYIKGNIFSLF